MKFSLGLCGTLILCQSCFFQVEGGANVTRVVATENISSSKAMGGSLGFHTGVSKFPLSIGLSGDGGVEKNMDSHASHRDSWSLSRTPVVRLWYPDQVWQPYLTYTTGSRDAAEDDPIEGSSRRLYDVNEFGIGLMQRYWSSKAEKECNFYTGWSLEFAVGRSKNHSRNDGGKFTFYGLRATLLAGADGYLYVPVLGVTGCARHVELIK